MKQFLIKATLAVAMMCGMSTIACAQDVKADPAIKTNGECVTA